MTKRKIIILTLILIGLIILVIAFWLGASNSYFFKDKGQVVSIGDEKVVEQEENIEGGKNTVTEKEAEVSDVLIEPDNDIFNWATYMSEEYGVEFRYPSDWQIIIKEKKLVVNSDNYKMGLAVTMEKTNQNLNQFIESYNSIDPTSRIIKQEQISLNNRPATRLLASTSIGIDYTYLYYTTQWGINYLIKYNEFSEIHNEIISTLRLLN